MDSPSFDVSVSADSDWSDFVDTALDNWFNTETDVNISQDSSSDNELIVESRSDTWYGLCSRYISGGVCTRFKIQINTRTITRDATNLNNFAVSSIVHEFGHPLHLADNPQTDRATIMSHNRNRNSMTTPQAFDVENVNNWYAGRRANENRNFFSNEPIIYIEGDYPIYNSTTELTEAAEVVVKARVVGGSVAKAFSSIPYTVTNFQVVETYKGNTINNQMIQVKQIGGQQGGQRVIDSSVEQFVTGEEYILYLETYADAPWSLLNPTQGAHLA